MTADDIIGFVRGLPGVEVVAAAEGSGAPEVAWGDTFFFYDPQGDLPAEGRLPFATIVTKDYPGFDTESDLAREGVFRVNVAVGRARFEELLGYPPSAHGEQHPDYRAADLLLPHPLYASQSWVSVVSPATRTSEKVRELLIHAHNRAAAQHRAG